MAEDTWFARVAVEEGFLARDVVDRARAGVPPGALADRLVQGGLLTDAQARTIRDIARIHLAGLSEPSESGGVVRHDRLVLTCSGCSTSYLIQGRPEGTRFDCRRCGRTLSVRHGGPDGARRPSERRARRVGPWVLGEEIGRGAASVVYRAAHHESGAVAAVKVLRDADVPSPAALKRFQEEARAIGRLSHPAIVPLLDAGEDAGYHYLAMGLVEGRTLAQAMAARTIRLAEFAAALETVARAVHHAHLQGIIHRDLKPANVVLDRDGRPHVMDFGLALVDAPEKGASQAGGTLGTPLYMSPEQVSGNLRATDARSDVYALGVMLYEALTGRVPFPGPTVLDVYRGILAGAPPMPRQLNPSAPRALEDLCLAALQRDRTRRPRSAEAFADALGAWTREARP